MSRYFRLYCLKGIFRFPGVIQVNEELANRNRELNEVVSKLVEREAPAMRGIKPKEPKRFLGGKNDNWHAWVRSLQLYLWMAKIWTSDEKIQTALVFLGGNASQTAQPYFQMLEEEWELGSFEAFVMSMMVVYSQIDREGTAKKCIRCIEDDGVSSQVHCWIRLAHTAHLVLRLWQKRAISTGPQFGTTLIPPHISIRKSENPF